MEVRVTYKGTLNGVHGLWCGFKPEGVEVEKEIPILYPADGKVLVKDNEKFDFVILQENEDIDSYTEVDREDEV